MGWAQMRLMPKTVGISLIMFVISQILDIGILFFGTYLIRDHSFSMVNVMAASGALGTALNSFRGTLNLTAPYTAARLANEDIYRIVDRKTLIDSMERIGGHMTLGNGKIEFINVSLIFPHAPEALVLESVTFEIEQGIRLALLGPSGCGKSSIVQLLVRFYDPSEGTLRIGGWDLREFNIAWWRKQLGYVSQEPTLFDVSLEDNVRYGCFDATHDEVLHVAKLAHMDYVSDDAIGWFFEVGPGGNKLSGGQKQRCAIARALIRKPKLFVLDEATSALDSKMEKRIQYVIDDLRGRAIITIAHRLSTIENCDWIVILANGSLRESGSFEGLLGYKDSQFWRIAHKHFNFVADEDRDEARL